MRRRWPRCRGEGHRGEAWYRLQEEALPRLARQPPQALVYEHLYICHRLPQSTIDVQKIVKWARLNKISLVPSGGRTGLSGAACALNGEVIVSFEKMNTILSYNPTDSTVHIQAGVITEELQNFALAKER